MSVQPTLFTWINKRIKAQNKQLTDLLQDLQDQQQQTHRDFERLKERNQELWRQVGSLRKKHDKQQDTVNRLISFMIHFIQQTPVCQLTAPIVLANVQEWPRMQFAWLQLASSGVENPWLALFEYKGKWSEGTQMTLYKGIQKISPLTIQGCALWYTNFFDCDWFILTMPTKDCENIFYFNFWSHFQFLKQNLLKCRLKSYLGILVSNF